MLKTFSIGGIHPAENKLSAKSAIQELPIPQMVSIPLSQHIGAPATAIVKKNDTVKVGQLIAKSGGFISANIHSSVSGTVFKIDEVMDSSGFKRKAIIIKVDGDEWLEDIDTSNDLISEIKYSKEEISKKVADAGIVGLGGATFPSHVKLSVPPGKTAEVLVINAVECEPYLTSDHQLMMEKGEEIIVGIQVLMKGIGVDKAIIGIENNKPDAIKHLSDICKSHQGIEVCPLKTQYPQGGEKQLIAATMNREVPSGALPIEVGAVVQNVGTAFAVYEAVQKNKPLIDRIVTVTGKSLEKPSNWRFRIGTPVKDLIEAAGGKPENTVKIVGGGPMMGKALNTDEAPLTKGSSGILLLNEQDTKRGESKACIRCGKCVSACPMGMEPHLMMVLAERKNWERLEQEVVMDCIECGSCSYTCPANRPLLDYIRLSKAKVGQIMRSRKTE
ncbi:MAG: electron transport complex subunit RsxC [Marinifilaceae bacterium]|nr:electron transport complex subunit RsxC [Marinifilaceae bacterium]